MIELLKSLGYTAGAVTFLIVVGYFFREILISAIKSVFDRDLEDLRQRNSEALQELKSRYDQDLENKKGELAKEVERLKSTLSVEAETYRLAAQNRFTALMLLWETSESLFKNTDFSDKDSIKKSLLVLEDALSGLDRYSVLMKEETAKHIQKYLEGILSVMTNSEKNLQENKIEHWKTIASISSSIVSTVALPSVIGAVTIANALLPLIVEARSAWLEGARKAMAMRARQELQLALRVEFGIVSGGVTASTPTVPQSLDGAPPAAHT
jgi:hypothetical protein